MTEARRLVITGIVQGVGFRYAMAREAMRLGTDGWVRNRRDGSVEAVVAGSGGQVAAMLAWARTGPPGARVDHVAVELDDEPAGTGFEQRPTA